MGSSSGDADDEKPSSPFDPTPSQPLLSKHFPSSSSSQIEQNDNDQPVDPEFNNYPQITFNYGPRIFRDLAFLIIFIVFSLSTYAFGIFSVTNRNPNYSNVSSFVYDWNTTSCVKGSSVSTASFFLFSLVSSSSSPLLTDLIWTLVVTLVLSGPLVFLILWSLKHYAKQIVYVSLPFFVVIPIFFNVYWFVACTVSPTCSESFPLPYRILLLVFVFLIIGVFVWIIFANWHRIELTVKIVGVASDALARNIELLEVLPCLSVGLLVFLAPIVVFLVFSLRNGQIVAKSGSEGEYYCAWKQDSWVPAYFTLAIVTMLWSVAVMVEAQAYVISGTIGQWYFLKEGSTSSRSIKSSLRNAFGPSFGTVCFSGLLIAAVRFVRALVDSARQETAGCGVVNFILQCCVNSLMSVVDFLNKFTINFAAITGEGYCSSAQMTYELLKRNLLSAVFVETVSTRILVGIIFVLSALYAILVCVILNAVSTLGAEVYIVAILAWLLLIVVLGFFVHVLDNVIETVYLCFAIDKDKGEVCKQEIHEVYLLLPISRDHRYAPLPTRTPLIA